MREETVPDFNGKVVAIMLATTQVSLALEEVRYERQMGKQYLVGRQVAHPTYPNWADGATYYIAPEQITFFAVFDSLDRYLARAAAWQSVASAPPASPGPTAELQRRGWFGRRA
jgi:hypothetical protein